MFNKIRNNSLIMNTGIYTLTSIINSAIPFLLLPILTRYLTPEDYGIVSMFSLLITFTTPFIGLSVNGSITRKYYDRNELNLREYIFNCILIILTSTILIGMLYWILSEPISRIVSFPRRYLWMVIVYTFSFSMNNVVLSLWQAQKKASYFGAFKNFNTLVNAVLSIMFVVAFGFDWKGRLYGQLIAVSIFGILAFYIIIKNKWIEFRFNKRYIYMAVMFGLPLIPHALSTSIISMTDRLFITNMIGIEATGIYTVGYQVGSIINLLALSFNNAYIPWLYERLKQNKYETKVKIVKFTYIYFIGIVVMALGLGFLAPLFLKFFLGKAFGESSIYVAWVALGYAFNGMYLMVVNYIFYAEKNGLLSAVTFSTAIINVALNYIFIKNFGAIGAAQSTTIVFIIKFVMVWALSRKVFDMPWGAVFKRQK